MAVDIKVLDIQISSSNLTFQLYVLVFVHSREDRAVKPVIISMIQGCLGLTLLKKRSLEFESASKILHSSCAGLEQFVV